MKKSPLVALLVGLMLAPLVGCGGSDVGATVKNVPPGKAYEDKPVDPNRVVDSALSWQKFVAEAKLPERMKQAEARFQEGGPANKVQIVFMNHEMEYAQFGDKSKLKNIDPNRLYEVGVITLASKETWGADGYQIREYTLKFITPRRDGEWVFAYGTYHVTKFQGSLAADPMNMFYVEDKEYQNGYLRQLFVKPLTAVKSGAGSQGGEQPVESR